MNKNTIKFILSVSVGAGILLFTLRYFDLDKTLSSIKGADIEKLSIALVLLVVAYLLRGGRWMIWEPNLKYWDSFKIIMVGFMGNNILPARLGEILRAHCGAAKINNNSGRTATLASIAIERILDGFVIAVFGVIGLLLIPLGAKLRLALSCVCILFLLLAAGLILGNYFHQKIRFFLERLHDIFPGHLTAFGKGKVNFFLDGLLMIRKPATLVAALGMTFVIWGVELVSYFLITDAVFPGAPFPTALIFLAVVNFASLFPFTVGGLGAIEGATAPYLIDSGIPFNQALGIVLIQHSYQLLFTTLVGGVFYFSSKYYEIPLVQTASPPEDAPKGESIPGLRILQDTRAHLEHLSQEIDLPRKDRRRIDLSIIIPAYNEKNRLPRTILETIKWCKSHCPHYEILVVDDGSTDETREICSLFSEYDNNLRFIANPHLGKGAAVRSGMLNAAGAHVLFMDADGATPLDEISKLRAKLDEGYPVVIGSRVAQALGETVVVTSLHRKLIGRTFAALVNLFGVKGIGDTQCGFKMFQAGVVKDIFSRQKLNGFAFDVEILFLARRLRLEIAEVPVNWENKDGSKVNLVFDSMKMLRDILKLKVLHRKT